MMSKLGQSLKEQREKLGLSLHEVGLSLKINPKVLSAIEEGNEQNLPAKTFLRGFVRSYSAYLKLDPNAVITQFQEEYGTTKPPLPTSETEAEVATEEASRVPRKSVPDSSETVGSWPPTGKTVTTIGSIVLIVLIIIVAQVVEKYQKEKEIEPQLIPAKIETPSSPAAETTAPLAPATPTTQVQTPAPSATPPAPAPTATSTSAPAPQASAAAPAPAAPTPPKPSTPPSPTPPAAAPTPEPSVPAAAASPAPKPAPRPTEVVIEALNPVEIKFNLGEGSTETIKLEAGQVHIFKSKSTLTLDVNDGGALNIVVNGKDRGVPGTIGKPVKLSYP